MSNSEERESLERSPSDEPALSEKSGRVGDQALERLRQHLVKRQERTAKLLERPEILVAVAEAISNTYAIVCDNFDPAKTEEVHGLLDKLKELGSVVVDRRDVRRQSGKPRKAQQD